MPNRILCRDRLPSQIAVKLWKDRKLPASATLIPISRICPDITRYITSWVDVPELVKDISSLPHRQPSMRDLLLAFGLGNDSQTVLSIYAKHSAGADVLRILVLLANLLAFPQDTTLQVSQVSLRKFSRSRAAQRHMANKMFFTVCLIPSDFFPLPGKGLDERKSAHIGSTESIQLVCRA